jgi:hypothetical protein
VAVLTVIGLGLALVIAGAVIHARRGRRVLPPPTKDALRQKTTQALP